MAQATPQTAQTPIEHDIRYPDWFYLGSLYTFYYEVSIHSLHFAGDPSYCHFNSQNIPINTSTFKISLCTLALVSLWACLALQSSDWPHYLQAVACLLWVYPDPLVDRETQVPRIKYASGDSGMELGDFWQSSCLCFSLLSVALCWPF